MTDKNPIVVMKGITIEFPGVKALDGVDLTLYPGEVHALMGENGAGKSTMIKALTGVYKINAGSIMVDGKPQQFNGTLDAQNAGIATVYQEVNLCTNLSVGENVMLGHEKRGPFGIDWKREQKAVEAEAAKGELGRFAPGLPKISDGQQLFVLNGLSKLAPGGKMAIIQNGSSLFAGDAGSGPSNIRQYILENDWLDAIVQLSTDQFMNTGISTYIWVLCKDKPAYRCGKVQLIDASHCYEQRRKAIGTKRNDISDHCRELIVQAYGEYRNNAVYGDKSGVYCESKIFGSEEFGYNKIVVERPQRDENGEIVMKRGKPVADAALRDTENVPLVQDIDAYFAREVLPYAPDAWIDKSKTKVGYEIPMTRYFYEYQPPEPVDDIVERIQKLEREIADSLNTLFHKEG